MEDAADLEDKTLESLIRGYVKAYADLCMFLTPPDRGRMETERDYAAYALTIFRVPGKNG